MGNGNQAQWEPGSEKWDSGNPAQWEMRQWEPGTVRNGTVGTRCSGNQAVGNGTMGTRHSGKWDNGSQAQ